MLVYILKKKDNLAKRFTYLLKVRANYYNLCNELFYFTQRSDRTSEQLINIAEVATHYNDNKFWWQSTLRVAVWTKKIDHNKNYL